MKKLFKNVIAFAIVAFLLVPVLSIPAHAQLGMNYAGNFGLKEAPTDDPRQMAVDVVKYLMTFLGIIAVVVILLGGFKWMTAAGNEDKVAEAKQLLIAGIIGLIIVVSAFAIVQFVVKVTNNSLTTPEVLDE